MVLNNYSYVHNKIRCLCFIIQQESGIKMETDLSQEFYSIFFKNELQYIRIDYKRNAYYLLNVRLTKTLQNTIEETLIYLRWLDIGNNYVVERKKNNLQRGKNIIH